AMEVSQHHSVFSINDSWTLKIDGSMIQHEWSSRYNPLMVKLIPALVVDPPGTLSFRDIPELPLAPGECRVAVRMAGICRTDLELVKGYMNFSGVPGHEFVGKVVAGSERLIGRRVVGEINAGCGRCAECRDNA